MATGWALVLVLGILGGSAVVLLAGAVGLGQYLRLRRRRGSLAPGPAWLVGTARPGDGGGTTAPVTGEPALAVEWTLEREGGDVAHRVWREVETRRDGARFTVETAHGSVRVDPGRASLDLAADYAETFEDVSTLRGALPASVSPDPAGADRYRLVERRLVAGDRVDATGHLRRSPDGASRVTGPTDPSLLRRILGVPYVLADPDRDGGAGLLRDRALAGFVLGLPPALLALVLLFPP